MVESCFNCVIMHLFFLLVLITITKYQKLVFPPNLWWTKRSWVQILGGGGVGGWIGWLAAASLEEQRDNTKLKGIVNIIVQLWK